MNNNKNKRATISDVARESGVAISTVSHVMNSTATISQATKDRVLEVAQRMDYIPSRNTVNKSGLRTQVIGVMVNELINEFYIRVVQAIINEALKESYTTTISEMAFNYKKEKFGVEAMLEREVAGIIFIGGAKDNNIIRHAAKQVPVILCDRKIVGSTISSVTTDNVSIMRNLVSQLADWGYTRIGYVSEEVELNNLKDRYFGFHIGLDENDLIKNKEHIIFHPQLKLDKAMYTKAYMNEYIEKLGTSNLPEVFVATSDLIAVGTIAALKQHNIRVPEDIGVVGFDDISIAAITDPPLTTVAQDMDKMGKYSFRNMLDLINNKDMSIPHSVVDASIVVRESVAIPTHINK